MRCGWKMKRIFRSVGQPWSTTASNSISCSRPLTGRPPCANTSTVQSARPLRVRASIRSGSVLMPGDDPSSPISSRRGPSTSRMSLGSSGTTALRPRVATCSTKAIALARSANAPLNCSTRRRRRRGGLRRHHERSPERRNPDVQGRARQPRPPLSSPSSKNDISVAIASVRAVVSPNQPAINTIVIGIPRIASCKQPSDDNAAITPDTTIPPPPLPTQPSGSPRPSTARFAIPRPTRPTPWRLPT